MNPDYCGHIRESIPVDSLMHVFFRPQIPEQTERSDKFGRTAESESYVITYSGSHKPGPYSHTRRRNTGGVVQGSRIEALFLCRRSCLLSTNLTQKVPRNFPKFEVAAAHLGDCNLAFTRTHVEEIYIVLESGDALA